MPLKFESPREEALEIARDTRKKIINNEIDVISALRSCLVIANILNKDELKEWVTRELFGYYNDDKIPSYRKLSCEMKERGYSRGFQTIEIFKPVSCLQYNCKSSKGVTFVIGDKKYDTTPSHFTMMVSAIIDKCLIFLNDIVTELQYGGTVENLIESIRKNTDEKLAKLDKRIVDEANSIFLNLTSTNPADWSKVGHSSRRMLILLADVLFPPQENEYVTKDNRKLKVNNEKYINRLSAFLDQKLSGTQRRLILSELEYFESYLRQVLDYAQKCEHKKSIEKYHANMLAIHTYLIISELLKPEELDLK